MGHGHGEPEGGPQQGHGRQGGGPQQRPGQDDQQEKADHLEHTADLWEKAFWQALHEVRVDFMKEKIKAAWGKNMGQTASAVLDAFHAEWKEFQEKEEQKAKEAGPADALKKRIKDGLKKGPL